jgi:hypothetical protein
MKDIKDINEAIPEEIIKTPTVLGKLSEKVMKNEAMLINLTEKIAEQTKKLETRISGSSHSDGAETGFNPTAAQLASVAEGINAEIEALGG